MYNDPRAKPKKNDKMTFLPSSSNPKKSKENEDNHTRSEKVSGVSERDFANGFV